MSAYFHVLLPFHVTIEARCSDDMPRELTCMFPVSVLPPLLLTGIIDILQQYNAFKRIETFYKSFRYDSRQISAVHPRWYAERFVRFVQENTD